MIIYDDENLSIKLVEHDDLIEMIWSGKGDEANTYLQLELYLEKLLNHLTKPNIVIHIEKILYFNSQCLSTMFAFLAKLKDLNINTTIYYTTSSSWQAAAIGAFQSLYDTMKFIKVDT